MKLAGKRKITVGYVIQTFSNDGKCIEQEFVAGDDVVWEDENGEPTAPPGCYIYQVFGMVQPGDDIEDMKRRLSQYEAEDYDRQVGGDDER